MADAVRFTEQSLETSDINPLTLDEPRPFGLHLILSAVWLGLGTLLKTNDEMSETGFPLAFPLLCLLVVTYAVLQLALTRRYQRQQWILNPTVQSALFVHVLPTASVLVLTTLPYELQESVGLISLARHWAARYEWLNLIGAVALWTGYWSGVANWLAKVIASSRSLQWVLRPGLALNRGVALTMMAIACGFRLLAVALGVYGYSASYETLIAAGAYTEYLSMASSLGRVALVAASLYYFESRNGLLLVLFLWCLETAFGVLSGFKSAVILPTIIVGLCYYAERSRIPRWLLPATLAGIFFAYASIEPFRAARNEEYNFDGTSLFSIVDTFSISRDVAYERTPTEGTFASTAVRFLSRTSDVGSAAPGIEYAAKTDILPEGSPDFLKNIFLAPFYSFIPRLLWKGKPINDLGLWYTRAVIGSGTMSSTAMYPVTYLNFAGGALAVFLGFLVVGVIQSALFRGVLSHGGAAVFVTVCTLGFLGHIGSDYYSFFISVLRYVPLMVLLQWLLFLPASNRALRG